MYMYMYVATCTYLVTLQCLKYFLSVREESEGRTVGRGGDGGGGVVERGEGAIK